MNNTSTKLLVSFTDVEGSKQYFYSSSLGGGEASLLCDLPGCDKGGRCTCYVSDTVNGVLCFSNGKDVYVLNPATRDILTLPKSSNSEGYVKRHSDPLVYSVYAFGFEPSNQEFKVLHIFGTRDSPGSALLQNQQCEVFKVRIKKDDCEIKQKEVVKVIANQGEKQKEVVKKRRGKQKGEEEAEEGEQGDVWRKSVSLPPCPYMFRSQGVCVNGSIYWIGLSSPAEQVIVSFDLESERFRFIPITFTLPRNPSLSYVRGRLAIQGIEKTPLALAVVWILEEDSKWNKNTASIINPKDHHCVLVGDDSTGDMVVMRSVPPEYKLVCLSGNKNTAAEGTITIGGLPSWVDLEKGKNNTLNFRIDNYVESKVPLDPVIVIVKEEKKPEVKEVGAHQQQPRRSQHVQRTYYHRQARGAQQDPPRATYQGPAQPPRQAHGAQTQQQLPQRTHHSPAQLPRQSHIAQPQQQQQQQQQQQHPQKTTHHSRAQLPQSHVAQTQQQQHQQQQQYQQQQPQRSTHHSRAQLPRQSEVAQIQQQHQQQEQEQEQPRQSQVAQTQQQLPERTHHSNAQPPRRSNRARTKKQKLPRASQPAQKTDYGCDQPPLKASSAQADCLTQWRRDHPLATQPAQKNCYGVLGFLLLSLASFGLVLVKFL